MTNTVHLGAWICYFLAMVSVGWIICERSSDWETERWGNSVRAMLLIFSAIALVCFWIFVGNSILGVNKMPDYDAYVAAIALGVVCGPFGYWVFRKYISPRLPASKPNHDDLDQVVEQRAQRRKLSLLDWLVIDLSTIRRIRKARRDRKDADK